ncbi:MAG: methyltransferase domain-containing protein, partial [Vicinamibacterales bacterium]
NYTTPGIERWVHVNGRQGAQPVGDPTEYRRPMTQLLACSVRGCGRPLTLSARAWTCANGHAFDIARTGYVNLLQPQDRRSAHAGDPTAAIDARGRLLATGVGSALLSQIVTAITRELSDDQTAVVDLGCGGGEMLGLLSQVYRGSSLGIDLAVAAVDQAARRRPGITWVVANADRHLPLLDHSVDLVTSIHARRNPQECARVLKPGGRLIVAVPAADDLVELREAVFGQRVERERTATVVSEHEALFTLDSRSEHRERLHLDSGQLSDLLTGTYRGARNATRDQRDAVEAMTVTLASEILLFRARSNDGSAGPGA